MIQNHKPLYILLNNKGALTLDFLMGIFIVFTLTALFGTFVFTLTVVESMQYAAYSSSRAYFAGNNTEKDQRELAELVYNNIKTQKIKVLNKPEWFELQALQMGDFPEYGKGQKNKNVFTGVRFKFFARILENSFPLLNIVSSDNYWANITSFMGREPTVEECKAFNQKKCEALQQVDPARFSTSGKANFSCQNNYAMGDNGC